MSRTAAGGHFAGGREVNAETMTRSPLSPDEVAQRGEVRRFVRVLIAGSVVGGVVAAIAAAFVGTPQWLAQAIILWALAAWLAASTRRALDSLSVETVVLRVGIVLIMVIVSIAYLQPSIALVMTMALLVPIASALPYLEARSLRRLLLIASLAAIAAIAASLLPDDPAAPDVVSEIVRLVALAIVIGLVSFLLYQSSARLRSSGREFRRLFQLSSDLAETTEPTVLGELVARHLAEATGFDDCVIYALARETGRLAPFGSHPIERSLETEPESLAERPILGRVIHDQERIVIEVC